MVPLEPYLGKKYKLKSSKNFDEYLKFIKVGFFLRKTASVVTPVVCLTRNPDDGSYTLGMTSTFKCISITFHLGEEFTEVRLDGVKVKSTMVLEGEDLIQTQIEEDGTKSIHIRKFTPTTLTVITTAEGWDGKCERVYELME